VDKNYLSYWKEKVKEAEKDVPVPDPLTGLIAQKRELFAEND